MKRKPRPDLRPMSTKTLDELEGFATPGPGHLRLPRRIAEARQVPLTQLTPTQCVLLLHHGRGVPYIFPRALALAEQDPWLWAEYYDGDLLVALLETDRALHPPGAEWPQRLQRLAEHAVEVAPSRMDFERNLEAETRVRSWLEALGGNT